MPVCLRPTNMDVCSRTSMNKLNNIHKKCLRLITNDYDSHFNELIESFHELSIHKTIINYLMIEVYKYLHWHFYSLEKSLQHSQYLFKFSKQK